MLRLLNRNQVKSQKLNIYNDSQNVHNSEINKSISQSIYSILKNNIEPDLSYIVNDCIFTDQTKQSLLEYCENKDIHSTLNVTFSEVFASVIDIIKNHKDGDEIKKILNTEMSDALCKCFTGRLSRLVNCLNGFDDRVNVKISSNDEISNVIVMIMNKNIGKTSDEIKELCKIELLNRNYGLDVIEEWLGYID